MATDCSSDKGQSGSPALVWSLGKWKIAGVLVGGDENQIDFKPYDEKHNSVKFVGVWDLDLGKDGEAWEPKQ